MSVEANTGVGQGGTSGLQTGNPQQITPQSLQMTRPLQGAGAESSVLGISSVLAQPTTGELKVETSNQSSGTVQTSQAPPINPNGFVFSPWLVAGVVAVLAFVAIRFIASQRKSAQF